MSTVILYRTTCKVCEALKLVLITALMGIWAFGETAGRARASAELARMGYYKEAKALMVKE